MQPEDYKGENWNSDSEDYFFLVWFGLETDIKVLKTVEEFIISGSQMHSSLLWLILYK